MTEWTTVTLREIAKVFDGPHATPPKTDEGPWYLSISSLKKGRFDLSESAHLSKADLPRWTKRVMPRPGDTLFSYETRLGEAAYWQYSFDSALGRRMGLLRPDPEKVDPRFLSYAYLGPEFQSTIRDNTLSGSTVDRIPVGEMPAWPIRIPDLVSQRAIAGVLGSIDDVIDNNRRRVGVLEEMARAIYREWFVKFRYPGHEGVRLVDSALGPVPDGWEETTLGEAARWLSGGTPKTTVAEYWNGDLPWITSGTLTSMLLDRSDRMLTELGAANGTRVVERDALLFVVRGMSLAKEFRVGIADVRLAFGQDVKALVASPGFDPMYLALSVITRAEEIQRMVEFAGHGTGKISTDRLQALHVLRPPMELQRYFADTFRPLREMMTTLRLAGDRLVRLRDDLLPRLVTGQIDVSTLDIDGLRSSRSTAGVGLA